MLPKTKILQPDMRWIIAETGCSWIPDAIIAPVNMKAMEMAVAPAKCLLNDRVKSSQMRGCGDKNAPPDHRADTAQPDAELVDVTSYAREISHTHAFLVQVRWIPLS
jgi:hypothetical protein